MIKRTFFISLLTLICCAHIEAQSKWSFRKFRREVDGKKELPYKGKQLWLFEKNGGWGLYDAETEQQLVPPDYDMVLPTIESIFFYVIRDNFVGFYAINGGELIPPDQFRQLQLSRNASGQYFVRNAKDIVKENHGYTIYTTKFRTFELLESAQKTWSVKEMTRGRPNLRTGSEVRIEDKVKWLREDQWIHHHTYIKSPPNENIGNINTHYFSVADQQSGVISVKSKTYLIPPEYAEIDWRDGYFQALSYTMNNAIDPLAYANVESIYTSDFRLIKSPPAGYAGLINGGGYYTYDVTGTQVILFDSLAEKIVSINDSKGPPDDILSIGDKYYLACFADGDEEIEMRVFNQNIYDKEGHLIAHSKFGFEQIYEDKGIAIVSVINPLKEYGLLFGVYDLENNQFLVPPGYTELYLMNTKNSLTEVPAETCDYYFLSKQDGKDLLWDCKGWGFAGVAAYVSGEGLEVSALEKAYKYGESSWMVTHNIEDPFNKESYGDLGYFHASIEDTYRGLVIYKAMHEYQDESFTYGLGYEDSDQLILAPEFKSIRFDKTRQTVELVYKDETYIFPLSRYEN